MLRAILGVVGGYLVIIVLVFAGLSAAYLGMGANGAFEPDRYDVTTKWVLVMFGVGFLAAILGGYACAAISRLSKPPLVLAGVVIVFGVLMAIPSMMTSSHELPMIRDADVGNFEAMEHAQTPLWVALLNPLLGSAGVFAGARLRGNRNVTKPS
jgi:ABC-type transport system involved in multi-copper enzyme maturation permease subunit